ncbi:DUF1232 domain-containing protein [Phototrophicus methaneseepsis]|uniref:DUF1232 domain-containing protein n=1 Tax=Phototrophicus methaneseepsis TaxID=2710758 RepID=A0A7S8ICN7_9CHLR|nr:YkvA family protein [Phototrophicus methaneseepsis]QPC80504.1 DUF1232 domain-containing protein [Phototrophicus methaneseepsis]
MFRKGFTLFWTAREQLQLTWALLRDDRVPKWQKAIPFLPLIYILSPLNFLTFAIPFVGQIDEVVLMLLAMKAMERAVDQKILAEYQKKLAKK